MKIVFWLIVASDVRVEYTIKIADVLFLFFFISNLFLPGISHQWNGSTRGPV